MPDLLLVNPRKRTRTKSRKRRSAAQKAATAKMLAANRRRRRGPARASKRRRSTALAAVPRRARRLGARRRATTRRRYARNPIGGSLKGIGAQFMDAGIMAGGAFGLDVLTGFVMPYIPAGSPLRTFPGKQAMKGVAAIALGMVAGMVVKGSTAKLIATGGLVSELVDAMRIAKMKYAPDIRLGDADPMGMWMDPSLGYVYEDPALSYDSGPVDGLLTDPSQPGNSYSYNSAEQSY